MIAEYSTQQLSQALGFLPRHLKAVVEALPAGTRAETEEIRLRGGRPMTVVAKGAELPTGAMVSGEDLALTLEIASQSSAYAAVEQVRHGFITVRGGHRIGLCGTGVVKEGEVLNIRQLSSLSLRVAREIHGLGAPLLRGMQSGGQLQSTLILSPPGGGKTTLLRDLIYTISEGRGISPLRVGVADERGELCGMYAGVPQMGVGLRTDVMDGCPKAQGMLMLLRGMNPQVLAVDEITSAEDVKAILTAHGCGVILLSSAHARGIGDMQSRPLYRKLLREGVFRRFITIEQCGADREYKIFDAEGTPC